MFSFLLLFPVFVASELDPAATVCSQKACFTWYREKLTFQETAKRCEKHGGSVATIRDQNELTDMEFVVSQLNENDIQFWIGLWLPKGICTLSSSNLKGFKWISGPEDSHYSNWKKEPKTTCTEERCVVVQRSSSLDLKWIDTSCKGQHFYLCQFYFKGMCPTLSVMSHRQVEYWLPFTDAPLEQASLARWPHGTTAFVSCGSEKIYTFCQETDGVFAWKDPGPYCNDQKTSCDYWNGGCAQLCVVGESGVYCRCQDGHELGNDGTSCTLKDECRSAPCNHGCLAKSSGFVCTCPNGFQLAADQISCVDVDECSVSHPCGENLCLNTNGSYICQCREGLTMVDGHCQDVDECTQSRCPQGCLNSQGSFSCHCFLGFRISDGGLSCVDVDECLTNRCEDKCSNTVGSYMCSCRPNFKLAGNGISCIPDQSGGSRTPQDTEVTQSILTVPRVTNEPVVTLSPTSTSENPSNNLFTHTPFGDLNTSAPISAPVSKSWVLVCVLASVIPLIILISLTAVIVICRCNRSRNHNKKQGPTADSYCWVSSGPGPTPEKIRDIK